MAIATAWFAGIITLVYVNSHCSLDPEAAIRESRSKMKRETFLALLFITLIYSSWRKCFSRLMLLLSFAFTISNFSRMILIVQSLMLCVGSAAGAMCVVAAVCLGVFIAQNCCFSPVLWMMLLQFMI